MCHVSKGTHGLHSSLCNLSMMDPAPSLPSQISLIHLIDLELIVDLTTNL